MKSYVITSGTIFGLLTAAHVWRIFGEKRSLATDPFFVTITLLALALCLWAFWVLARAR